MSFNPAEVARKFNKTFEDIQDHFTYLEVEQSKIEDDIKVLLLLADKYGLDIKALKEENKALKEENNALKECIEKLTDYVISIDTKVKCLSVTITNKPKIKVKLPTRR